jgi:hypothetical protein
MNTINKKTVPTKWLVLLALVTLAVWAPPLGAANGRGNSEIQTGFAIAPVPLDLKGKNPAHVARGSYIVNAQSACNDCHTCPSYAAGSNPYLDPNIDSSTDGKGTINANAYLAGGVPFTLRDGEIVHSFNLTTVGKPGGLPLEHFMNHMRTGMHMGDILQVMPWPIFRNMTDSDLEAIYEYLSAIPQVATPDPAPCQGPGETAQQ